MSHGADRLDSVFLAEPVAFPRAIPYTAKPMQLVRSCGLQAPHAKASHGRLPHLLLPCQEVGVLSSGFGSTVVDSGTTYTFLPHSVYERLAAAVKMSCKSSGKCGKLLSSGDERGGRPKVGHSWSRICKFTLSDAVMERFPRLVSPLILVGRIALACAPCFAHACPSEDPVVEPPPHDEASATHSTEI